MYMEKQLHTHIYIYIHMVIAVPIATDRYARVHVWINGCVCLQIDGKGYIATLRRLYTDWWET